jgi:outer membrane receptor protein involved in Fe transport
VLQLVPNLLVPTSRDTPIIRGQVGVGVLQGLPAFLGGARPRTAMQIDGRTVTFYELVNSTEGLWDVDRVEVFRSPQTTTQGVNSIAGAIFIHTTDPTYDYEGRARLIGGDWDRRQASALVSGPIIEDQLAFRVSGDAYRAHPSTTMFGPIDGVDLNVDRYWTTRAKLLAEPHALPGLRVLTIYAHTHAQAPQGELARPPLRKRRDDFYPFGYFKSDVDSITNTISYPLGDALESRTTLTWGKSHFRRFAPEGYGQNQIHADDNSLESVLQWKPDEALSAIGGLAFQTTHLRQFINLDVTGLGTGSFKDKQRNAGVFGELTWRATDRVTLIAGARYQSDGKKRIGVLRMTPEELPLDYDKTTRAFLPKLSATYDIDRDWRIGLLLQRAYNPGGVTLDPQHHKQLDFKPEYLWDYEAFVRASMFGGRATLNGNLFYNAMRDAQRELDFDLNSPGGPVGLLQIISEPKARTYGAELELTARPARNLTLTAGLGWLDTKIIKGIATNDPFLGKEFAGAPHFTAAGAAEWQPVRDVHLSTQVRREAAFNGDDSGDDLFKTEGFWMVDARAGVDVNRFTFFAYAQNLFDTFKVIGWNGPRDDPFLEVGLTDPREIGVGLDARF